MIFPKVTLTMTTSKRYNLFAETINSFFENCLDTDLIQEIILIDDCSSRYDFDKMKQLLQDIPIQIRILVKQIPGHVESLNILFSQVKTDYIFHLEDDWKFTIKDNFIRDALQIILNDADEVKIVIMRNWIKQGAKQNNIHETMEGIKYYIHDYNYQPFIKGEINTYPGYSLNPSLQHIKDIRENIGLFRNVKLFELDFALRYCNIGRGYKVALTDQDYCQHIGGNVNAYTLNNTEP